MVGMFKKFNDLLKLISQYAPALNHVSHGLSNAVQFAARGVGVGGQFINAFHDSYKESQNKKRYRRIVDGIRGGFNSITNNNSGNLDNLSNKIELSKNDG
jgi:hypothetical protein